jgi:MFS transporter, DHA1 family, tetracycline resistance protein
MGDGQKADRRGAALPFILVTVLLDTLGIGLIIPVGPRLVASFLQDDLSQAAHYFGLLMAVYSLMQLVFAPILGGLSDRFGRRTVILVSLFGAACSYLTSALAPALFWLFLGRTVAGITGASFSAANAYVADITPPEKRAGRFGMVGAVFGLGFILGPALGGVLGDRGLRVPYFVGAALNGLNLLYGFFVLPESLPPEHRRPFTLARANPIGSLKHMARYPTALRLIPTLFCAFLAQFILQGSWALSMQARFGWSLKQVGISLMTVGLGMALVQGLLVRKIVPALGERRSLLFGLGVGALGHAAIAAVTDGSLVYVVIMVLSLGGIAGPSLQAILSSEVGPKEQGELGGALNVLQGLAAIIGPVLGTTLLARFGPDDAHPHVPGAPFYMAALMNLIGLILAVRVLSGLPERAGVAANATPPGPVA